MNIFLAIAALIPCYLIGVLPSGYLIGRFYGINLSASGSGNIGATNAARVLGSKAGILTLLCDVTKGALAVLYGILLTSSTHPFSVWCGAAAVLGHCFSIPGKLRGGKGVATSLGVILVISKALAVLAVALFVLVFLLTKKVSPASLVATVMTPIHAMIIGLSNESTAALVLIAIIIFWRHRENLHRLSLGTEAKFSLASDPERDRPA